MINLKWFLLGVILNIYVCEGYRILIAIPLPSKSHGILGDKMVKHLISAGHDVTYITPFPKKVAHPNLHQVDVSDNQKFFNENSIDIKLIMEKLVDFQDLDVLCNLMIGIAQQTFENPNMQKFLQDPQQKFDLIVSEWMFTEIYSALAVVYECPFIWLSTMEPHWQILNFIDGPLNPAYTNYYQTCNVAPLTFTERLQELWIQIAGLTKKNFKYYYQEEELYQRYIAPLIQEKGRTVPWYQDVIYNISLVLGNSQAALGNAVSLPQSYQHVGGYHIDEEVIPLPENLKSIFDHAEHGVIYFSMGSNIKSKDLPIELKRGILKTFAGLKQTVLWKFEEALPDLPKNVHIVQWAPQQSILAHPNTRLFITHGGLLSLTETANFGVPAIVIPAFADQFVNAKRAEMKGYAKKVDLTYTLYDDLKEAINEVLNDPKYADKAKSLAGTLHDLPIKPKDALLYWIAHVVRTQGAPHLRSPALPLPLYQRLYLDLVAIVLVLILALKATVKRFSQNSLKLWSKKEKKL